MKITTFNVNDINKRLSVLLRWLDAAEPDVVCLQELKAPDDRFPVDAIGAAGYAAVCHGQRTWNGVAILARGRAPVLSRKGLPGDPSDRQSRYIEAAVGGILIASLYAPNGNPQPGPKFAYKLAWTKRLIAHAARLLSAGVPVVLAGDYNIAPGPDDVYAAMPYPDNALVQPESRALFRRLIEQGWVDAIRATHPCRPALHVLGLSPEQVAARPGAASRPPAARGRSAPPPDSRRRGPGRPRPRGRQRPCTRLDRARLKRAPPGVQGVCPCLREPARRTQRAR